MVNAYLITNLLTNVTNFKEQSVMKKIKIILSSILWLMTIVVWGQTSNRIQDLEQKINNIENRPLKPDWVDFLLPDQDTYFFKRIAIQAEDVKGKLEADMLAQQLAFQAGADYLGYHVNVAALEASMKGNSDELYIDGQAEKKISARLVCEYQETDKRGSSKVVTYWYLYEISKSGRIIAKFDTDFECSSRKKSKARRDTMLFDLRNQIKSIRQKEQADSITNARKSNAKALFASMFIPGAGQMMKKQGGKGAAFLISELVLFGGSTACYFLGQDQIKIMKSTESSYDDYKNAKKLKNTYDIAMYVGFGVGAAVHITNMVHAYVAKDKRNQSLTFAPAIIPANEYTRPTYAYGVGLQYKF